MDHQTVPPLAPEQDGALIAELSVRLRRRPDASSLQFILNVAQLLGQSAHNAPLLLPLLPMILHGMARHLESDGVHEAFVANGKRPFSTTLCFATAVIAQRL